jgi:hypothetical protein
VLVVRVPNARFYRSKRRELQNGDSRNAVMMLGYNNLLAFPYLHGFTLATLDLLLRKHNFEPIATHNSSVLIAPYPEMSGQVRREWWGVERLSTTDGPWIEIVSRRAETA